MLWFQFIGTTPFSFSMTEMTNKWGDLVGKELFVKGWLNDYYFMEVQNGTSVTRVIQDGIVLKRLGKKYRTFKPGVPFTVYVCVGFWFTSVKEFYYDMSLS